MIEVLEKFVSLGGDGIELKLTPKEDIPKNCKEILEKFVKKHDLVISGGTDFHEKEEGGDEIGDRGITRKEFEKLKSYWKNKYKK